MDLTAINKINSVSLVEAYNESLTKTSSPNIDHSGFGNLLANAMDQIGMTNAYLSSAENEQLKWALGETTSTHDLSNALQKASVSLQYTVAIRDKVLEAYKEIMQMQI
jgi:flagellar hook-basal body complex protein FliE